MNRTGKQRLDAMPGAIARGDEFRARVAAAAGDAIRCADLMAEAIAMDRDTMGLEIIGRDGKQTLSMERLQARYCLDEARAEYLLARGSNAPVGPEAA